MSEDVNKDIKKAMQDAEGARNGDRSLRSIELPNPITLKYSSDEGDVKMPAPTFRLDGKDKK